MGHEAVLVTRQVVKDLERAALDALVAHVDLGTQIDVVPDESPDFLLTVDGQVIGVEVVELVDNGMAAGMASYRTMAADLKTKLVAGSLNVTIRLRTREGFIPKLVGAKVRKANLNGLLSLAQAHVASGADTVTYDTQQLRSHGVEWLIKATFSTGRPDVHEFASSVGFGLSAQVQHHVDAKEKKLPEYRKKCSGEVWLLMIAGTRFASGIWSETVRGAVFQSGFDRIFYVDGYDNAVFEVGVEIP